MILKLTTYKNYIIFSWNIEYLQNRINSKNLEDDDMMLPHDSIIGTQLYKTSKNLGISNEALKLIETKSTSKVGDDLTEISFTNENYIGILGGPRNMCVSIKDWENPSYGYTKPKHIIIQNDIPQEAKDFLDKKIIES